MSLFDEQKKDMKTLIELSAKIAEYQQRRLFCSNFSDKRNYNEDVSNRLSAKTEELIVKYNKIYNKWFVDPIATKFETPILPKNEQQKAPPTTP